MKRNLLICFFSAIAIAMTLVTIKASLEVSLWAVLPRMLHEPWTAATLMDFYFNITILSSWVFYKEQNKFVFLLWVLAFVALGSIATSSYVVVQLLKLKDDEPLANLLRRHD